MSEKEAVEKNAKRYVRIYKICFAVLCAALIICGWFLNRMTGRLIPSVALSLSLLFYGRIWLGKIRAYSVPMEEMDERTRAELMPDRAASLFGTVSLGVIFLALAWNGLSLVHLSGVGGTSLSMLAVGIFLLLLAFFVLGVMLPWIIELFGVKH